MTDNPLSERKQSLEEEYFRKQNEEKLGKLRATQARDSERERMASVSGVTDTATLDRLIDSGLTAETIPALALAPLVAVAWADHRLEPKERDAVLSEAAASGLEPGTPGHGILEGWLQQAPDGGLMATWRDYVQGLAASLPPEGRRDLRESILARAKAVAASAGGGFAGLGSKVSSEEEKALKAIETALPD